MNKNEILNIFFSKETISSMNNSILISLNKVNTLRSEKKEIIDKLIDNMKKIYKNLDITKIEQENFQSVFNQFKTYSIQETCNDINSKNTNLNNNKFDRNLEIGRMATNTTFLNRPESTTTMKKDNNTDNKDDIIDTIHNKRMMEVGNCAIKPELPDFLKSSSTKISTKDAEVKINTNTNANTNTNTNTNTNINIIDNNSSSYNKEFENFYSNNDDTLFSFDNFSIPLVDNTLLTQDFDENISFDQRLKNLQNSRNEIKD